MKIQEKLSKAKAKLLVDSPAYGRIVGRMAFIQNDDIQNCISDGSRFEYNDDFLSECTQEELHFALSHAALHAVLKHAGRKKRRANYLWQLATDYAISSMLKESGHTLPDFARYQKRFDGLYAEEIYEILKDEIKNEEFSDDEELDTGFNETNKQQQKSQPNPPSQNQNKKNEDEYKMEAELEEKLEQKFIEQLLEEFDDEMPEAIKRHLKLKAPSKTPWRSHLRNAMMRYAKNDYSLYPPSKKLLYEGIYLPSLRNEELHLCIVVDTSGSIDDALLDTFLSEVAAVLLHVPAYSIDFIAADDHVREHIRLQKGAPFPQFLTGGCGTDFRVVFEYIKEKSLDPDLLLYFTDMQGFFPKSSPSYEVVWVTHNAQKAPFGRVLEIRN